MICCSSMRFGSHFNFYVNRQRIAKDFSAKSQPPRGLCSCHGKLGKMVTQESCSTFGFSQGEGVEFLRSHRNKSAGSPKEVHLQNQGFNWCISWRGKELLNPPWGANFGQDRLVRIWDVEKKAQPVWRVIPTFLKPFQSPKLVKIVQPQIDWFLWHFMTHTEVLVLLD